MKAFGFRLLALGVVLASCQPLPAAEPGVQMKGGATAGNIPIITRSGLIDDSGVAIEDVSGLTDEQAAAVDGLVAGTYTGIVTSVITEEQTELQRQSYTGTAGQLVRNTTESKYPLTQFDGTTVGGIPLVGWSGAIISTEPVTETNTVDFSGWTTTGNLTNGLLTLDDGEYLISPIQTHGVAFYEDSIYAPGAGSTWTITVYTNTVDTAVDLPYYGDDARLRVDYGTTCPLIGEMYAGVGIPATNGIIISGFERVDILDTPRQWAKPFSITAAPVYDEDVSRFLTVKTYYTNAITYSDARLAAHYADKTKRLRGNDVLLDGLGRISSSASDTNRTITLSVGGVGCLDFTVPVTGLTINDYTLNGTTLTANVSTNGVLNIPIIEWHDSRPVAEWQGLAVISNSYPTAIGSNYVVAVTVENDAVGYLRAVCQSAQAVVVMPTLPASTNGLATGTLWNDGGTLKIIQ